MNSDKPDKTRRDIIKALLGTAADPSELKDILPSGEESAWEELRRAARRGLRNASPTDRLRLSDEYLFIGNLFNTISGLPVTLIEERHGNYFYIPRDVYNSRRTGMIRDLLRTKPAQSLIKLYMDDHFENDRKYPHDENWPKWQEFTTCYRKYFGDKGTDVAAAELHKAIKGGAKKLEQLVRTLEAKETALFEELEPNQRQQSSDKEPKDFPKYPAMGTCWRKNATPTPSDYYREPPYRWRVKVLENETGANSQLTGK